MQDENTVFALGGGITTEEVFIVRVCWGPFPSSRHVTTYESVLANFMSL